MQINCTLLNDFFPSVSLEYEGVHFSICVGDDFQVTCYSTTSVICWGLVYPSGSPIYEPVCFNTLSEMSDAISNFSLILLSRNPYISTATLASVSSNDNGIVLTCKSTFALIPEPEEIANVTLLVQGTSSK